MKFCDEIEKRISLYIDHELDNDSLKDFEQHISLCNECRDKFEEVLFAVELCKDITDEEPPTELYSLIFDRINMDNNTLSKTTKIMSVQKYIKYISLAAVACLCVAVILTGIFRAPGHEYSETQISSMADSKVSKNSAAVAPNVQDKSVKNQYELKGSGTFNTEDATSRSSYSLKSDDITNDNINVMIYVNNFNEELNYIRNLIYLDTGKTSYSGSSENTTTSGKNDGMPINIEISKSELEILIKDLSNRYNSDLQITKNIKEITSDKVVVIISLKSK